MPTTALQLSDVTKKFGRQTVLSNINMTIQQGDIYGLIGENGAGKSTLMRLITGLSPLRSGQIMLLGASRNQAGYNQALQRIGTIIESPALYPHLTVYQNLMVSAKQKGVANRQDVLATIQFVGLTEKTKTKANRLSLGQRQRLGLAIALLAQPDFLILDEPINGLEPHGHHRDSGFAASFEHRTANHDPHFQPYSHGTVPSLHPLRLHPPRPLDSGNH